MSSTSKLTSWKTVTFETLVADTQLGTTERGEDESALNVDLIKMGNLTWGGLALEEVERVAVRKLNGQADLLQAGDLLFNTRNSADLVGKSAIWRKSDRVATYDNNINRIRLLNLAYPEFIVAYLNTGVGKKSVQSLAVGSTSVAAIYWKDLSKLKVPLPPLPEQRKIAEILRTWGEAIEKLEALRAAKLRAAAAFRLRIFEEALTSANRTARARDLFEPISERARPDLPLLAVMQDIGIVRRDALDRRVAMPEGDTSTYKVVRPGDFVISLRSFEGGLEYSDITGLVSPAYTVLRARTELVGTYYRHFFKSRSFIGRLDKLIFGIRDGKQIAFRDFGDMQVPAPPLEDQHKNAEVLTHLERDTALSTKHIDLLTRQKRGLMQKLLTGEWRVHL
ncbi:MAG: restriction endonuclease subunit S [Alphaproteobacteria bacterium]|jgi:type I restriction enzyme S subunit